jgi:hypothetical protein
MLRGGPLSHTATMTAGENIKKMAYTALLSGGLAVASVGLGAGTALAIPDGPHHWCPGQQRNPPNGPGQGTLWDWNVCHTFWFVGYGQGNVPASYGAAPTIWEGDNPPGPPPPGPVVLPGL